MGFLDDMDDKAKDIMNDPEKRKLIELKAKEKGISVEQAAREHLSGHDMTE